MLGPRIEPGLILYMQRPMTIAIGIVIAIVNVPQELSASALTTTRPSPASAMTTMNRIATPAVKPATGPISARAISASERPLWRTEATRIDEVVHAPAEHRADEQPQEARAVAELRRQHRSDQRPGAGDRGEVVPEQHPLVRRDVVVAVLEAGARASRAGRRARAPWRR